MMNILVVLNYNDWKLCTELIDMVVDYKNIDRIIVVDNLSTDDSYDQLEKKYSETDKVDIIVSNKNGGYAYGNNFGIKYAISNYNPQFITIANPDVQFTEETLDNIIIAFQQCNNPAAITCKMNCKSGIDLPSAWKEPNYFNCLVNNFILLKRIIGDKTRYSYDYLHNGHIKEVDVLPGSFFVVATKPMIEVGCFDENTFLYYEEAILSKRLHSRGYKNYILVQDEYIHNHSISINKTISSVRNRLLLAGKSGEYYCKEYLAVNHLQIILYRISIYVGATNYTLARRAINFTKRLFKNGMDD